MKAYVELPLEDRALQRVRDALVKYAPGGVEFVSKPSESDLVVLHVFGRHDNVQRQVELLREHKKPYVIIQYAIRSTKNPLTQDWIDMWTNARLVWSYYYLPELCFEDKLVEPFPFYHAPLGVDSDVFYDRKTKPGHKAAVIACSSRDYLTESAKECVQAAKLLGKKTFYLGQELDQGSDVFCKTGITDAELAYYYSCCEFVSGLRRIEGFELPAAEGLLCGARPILFDKPHYRKWFDGLAIFIPETPREVTVRKLVEIFERGAKPVTDAQIQEARVRFNWQTIVTGFWERLLV